jgi:hypothetical protein
VPETKTPFRIKPLTILAIAAAVVLVVVTVVYLMMSHPKHALVFFGLAVLAVIGAWFSTGTLSLETLTQPCDARSLSARASTRAPGSASTRNPRREVGHRREASFSPALHALFRSPTGRAAAAGAFSAVSRKSTRTTTRTRFSS